jgi:hypothetical protein
VSEYGYLVRKLGSGFEVTKWGDSTEPLSTYEVYEKRNGWGCNSPGCHRKTKCKHARIVIAWQKLKKSNIVGGPVPVMLREDGTPFIRVKK